MKTRKLFFLVILTVIMSAPSSFAQNMKVKPKFAGRWINTQYEQFKNVNNNLATAISPQILLIDSSGRCTLLVRQEQRQLLGRPKSIRTFGDIMQLTFKVKNDIQLTEVKDNKDYIILSCPTCAGEILFKRY